MKFNNAAFLHRKKVKPNNIVSGSIEQAIDLLFDIVPMDCNAQSGREQYNSIDYSDEFVDYGY